MQPPATSHFESIHPYTLELIDTHPLMDSNTVCDRLAKAELAYHHWRKYSFNERAAYLQKVADLLLLHKEELARLITLEMGKVLPEAKAEIEKCALICRYYAENTAAYLADSPRQSDYQHSYISYEPLGAILGIMPWNYPFWQVFRYAVPALMAGNVTLLKHAPNVCGCSKKIEALFLEAGIPSGVFQSLIIDTSLVEQVISSPIIQGVSFTGSNRTGSLVAALAGKYTKKSVLELGGSDALLVLVDADIEQAARIALQSRMLNAGQTCNSAKRMIVVKEAADAFLQQLLKEISLLKQGDPFDAQIKIGPLARPDLANNIQSQVTQSLQAGASCLYGGRVDGYNVQPTLLLQVEPGMAAFDEETFGPLACVTIAENETAAIALANRSVYGLAASIWSRDMDKAIHLARQLEAGNVFINTLVKSDPQLPFGGIKASGYGRELGREGIVEFVNSKTIAGGNKV